MIENVLETLRIVDGELSVRWSLTLMHFVWQGAVVGLLAVIVHCVLAGRSASTRYALHAIALLSLPLCVAVTFASLEVPFESSEITALAPTSESASRDEQAGGGAGQGIVAPAAAVSEHVVRANNAPNDSIEGGGAQRVSSVGKPAAASAVESANTTLPWLTSAAPWVTGVHLAAVACMFLRLLLAIQGGNQLRSRSVPITDPGVLEPIVRQARRMGLRFVPLLAYCEKVAVPTVVGVLRPAVLLPASSLTGLDSNQLVAIIAHELAHIRRHDLVINLVQRLVESLLFFHPAVWYISHRMSVEREICCDDLAIRAGCPRAQYADALLRAAELCVVGRGPRAAALGAIGNSPSQLERRIQRLLVNVADHPRQRLTRGGILMIASIMVFSAVGIAVISSRGHAEPLADSPRAEDADAGEFYVWDCSTVDEVTGSPVAGVHVTWRFRRPHPVPAGTDPLLWEGAFVSDQNGEYQVRVPRAIVDAVGFGVGIEYRHPRYLPQRGSTWPLRMPEDPLGKVPDHRHIQMEPGVKVFGVISNPDGSPARNIPVMFARSRDGFGDSNGGYYHGFWTSTGDDGRYEFYTRNTWPQRIHWYPAEYAADSRALTKEFGEQPPIRLKPGFVLTGKVIDAQDQPLAGIVVRASTGTRVPYLFAISDAEGIYRFTPLPSGTYRLTPVRSYHDTQTGDSLSASLPYPIPSIEYPLDTSTASPDPKAIIQASPLIKIPVEVADGEGNPISDGTLSIGDMGNFTNAVLAQAVEGVPGRYEFQFPRDQYISDLAYRRSMGEAAFYQLNTAHPPVAAEAIVLGKAEEDFPTIRVVVRKAASLTVLARTEDGTPLDEDVQVDASYSSATEERIQAAEQANRTPQGHFTMPRMFHTHPAGRPWNPTFQQVIPGEPVVVTIRSNTYTAQPLVITLQDGEQKSIELPITIVGSAGETPEAERPMIP